MTYYYYLILTLKPISMLVYNIYNGILLMIIFKTLDNISSMHDMKDLFGY